MAQSTVALEIADNLHIMLEDFKARTGELPMLVMDNIRIQSCIPKDVIESRYGDTMLAKDNRLEIPAHSPDLNQTIEQSVGVVKGDVIGQVADLAHTLDPNRCYITAEQLRKMGEKAADRFAKAEIFNGGVMKSVHRMPVVWGLVGAAEVEEVVVSKPEKKEKKLHGTAGDWAPCGWR